MLSDRLGFLEAICRDPADDLLRLVYADWLDEHGESERAKFIRDGCEFLDKPQRPSIHWLGYPLPSGPGTSTVWRRGFVAEVTCSAEDWLAHGDSLTWGWDRCGRCGGNGNFGGYTTDMNPGQCDRCDGSGRVQPTMTCEPCGGRPNVVLGCQCKGTGRGPRPCPPTAQPIETVNLTTWPQIEVPGIDVRAAMNPDLALRVILPEMGRLWPGIRFTLSATSYWDVSDVSSDYTH